jgi:hypothetical protein
MSKARAWLWVVGFWTFLFVVGTAEAAQCVGIDGNGFVVAQAASGTGCSAFVVLNPVEYGLWLNSPLNLSLEDGVVLAVGIVACWAAAFAWRAAIRALGDDAREEV